MSWSDKLAGRMPETLAREIDQYQQQIELKKQGKVDDKLFQEARLRRGSYGQRYDNGQRHDGIAQRDLPFQRKELRKGPETLWDAPGMQRIKLTFGGFTPEQMEVHADIAEEYSDAIVHITTRQDTQLHYVHIEDTPDLMRRLATVGITSREACGNSVRNVTACPKAGCCGGEVFDVSPYAIACARFLMGHRDAQDFGRKFKVAFSGCPDQGCAYTGFHDLGFVAATRPGPEGTLRRGFAVYVGGGLGPVPYQASLLAEFVPEDEIFPVSQAICRIYGRHGEKKNRGRARIKFLVAAWGIEKFRAEVEAERRKIPQDDAWTSWLDDVPAWSEQPSRPGAALAADAGDAAFRDWRATNVKPQKHNGYVIATVKLPLGDITSWQLRQLADISRKFNNGHCRTTVEQNIVMRWVSEGDLPELYRELQRVGLAASGANTIEDVVSCPGTDTCKLGIASSRGLAATLSEIMKQRAASLDPAVRALRIHTSGCFNSCSQHQIADLGFYGVSRKVDNATVPHFRVVLGARRDHNAREFGQTFGPVPSKRVPEFIDRLTEQFLAERQGDESFPDYIQRIGKKGVKPLLDELGQVPPRSIDRTLYSDWRDPREFNISDIGIGECAGAVVSTTEFDLQAAEQMHYEAQVHLDEGDFRKADDTAYAAMVLAAKGLVYHENQDVPIQPDTIVAEFRVRYHDSGRFHDPKAPTKFAEYLFRRHDDRDRTYSVEAARRVLEETQHFVEAAYSCYARITERPANAATETAPAATENA
ncbi:MAG: nitrite/sulfite reductase [Gammaproteobacteria bacterium]|nr:nitrite/sulfite reductase [Gammaproteobacteria bacterium]